MVSVGEEGQMFVLSLTTFQAYYVSSYGEDQSEYTEVDGEWKHMDAGKGALIGVNLFNEVFERLGINGADETTFTGTSWEQIPGR
jgi:hypothetical protein